MVLIVAAALFLAHVWGLDVVAMMRRATSIANAPRCAARSTRAVIILAADFGWSIIKAVIARAARGTCRGPDVGQRTQQDPRRRGCRTLLPIFHNILFVVIVVMALLMALSSLGVEIGPLIAGAGVVGVAIGFGAQTVVKDVISGIFYLLDDAFRVGEYIQSGNYKGTVEVLQPALGEAPAPSRLPVYTVPFGELGAVQNMSRDWVIDKFTINVDYDTDIEKARKIVKKIGQNLAEDPEFAPHIIEPLKMQGVENFGDFGIELRMKMMTQAGRAVRHPPQGVRRHQEGVRGERHQDRRSRP